MLQGPSEEHSVESVLSETERTLLVGHDRPIQISTGHRIRHHEGKCSRPHGHNYAIVIEVTGGLTEEGWVVDKGDITEIISHWDHRFILEQGDPLIEAFQESGDGDSVIVLDYPPTAEVMGLVLEQKLKDALPDSVTDVTVKVQETGELAAGDRSE